MDTVQIRILLVEDNPADVLFLREALARDPLASFDLTVVESLAEALEILPKQGFSAALLDLGLPDSQGLNTFIKFHQAVPELPLVVLSALDDEDVAMQAMQAGAQDYLVKRPQDFPSAGRALRYAIERQQSQAALRESEQFLNESQRIARMGSWRLDLATFKLTWSENCYRLFGFEPGEIEPTFDLFRHMVYPADAQLVEEASSNIVARPEPFEYEYRIVDKLGRVKWLYNSITPIMEGDRAVQFTGIHIDITERKLAEEKLRESEEKFRSVVECTPDIIFAVDRQNRIQFINRVPASITIQSALGTSALDYVQPAYRSIAENAIRQVFETGQGTSYEIEARGENDTVAWYATRLVSLNRGTSNEQVLLVTQDISERKKAEAEKARLAVERDRYAERMQLILDQMPIACLMNDPDFNVVYWNRAAETIFGFSAAEMLGRQPYGTFVAEEARGYVEELRQQMAVHGKSTVGLNKNYTKDGREILCEWHNNPLHDENGRLTGFLAMAEDVTDRKRAEEELRERETLFRQVLESTQDAIFAIDRDYRLLVNNTLHQQVLVATGGHPFEVGENVFPPAYPPETLAGWRAMYDRAFQGESSQVELAWMDIYGNPRAYENNISPLRSSEGDIIGALVVAHNITERRQAESQKQEALDFLQQERTLLRILIDNLPDYVFMKDLQSRFLVANRAVAEFMGVASHEQLIGKTDFDFYPEEGAQLYFEAEQRWMQLGENVVAREYLIRGVDKKENWLSSTRLVLRDSQEKVIGLMAIDQNITERKKAEDALVASENRFRALIEHSSDGIVLISPSGEVLYESPSASRLNGFTFEERRGRSGLENIHPDDLPAARAKFAQLATQPGATLQVEYRALRKDGSQWWAEAVASNLLDEPGVQSIVINFRDITDRKQAEEQLHESEERYHQAIIAADAIPYALDYTTLKYTFIGEGIEKLTGYPAQGLGLNDFNTLLLETVMQGEFKGMEAAQAAQLTREGKAGRIWKCQHHILGRNGQERWLSDASVQVLDGNGMPVGSIGILQDITEHKETEKMLAERVQQATAEIQDLYNNAPTGYHSLGPDGIFLHINDTELRWLGYTREEVVGKKRFSDFLTPESLLTFKDSFPAFKQRGFIQDLEFEMVRKNGSTIPVLVTATAIYDAGGNFVMSRSTLVDHTDRNQAEKALKDSEARYRLLFENMTEGFGLQEIITDASGHPIDFRFIHANSAYERHTGMRPQDIIGKTLLEINPQADRSQIEIYGQVALTGQPLEFEYYSKTFNRYFSVRAFSPQSGQFATLFEDISERKKAEEMLRESEAQIRVSRDKLSAANAALEKAARMKDEFLASMSHELRTPLTGILGLSEALQFNTYGTLTERQDKAIKNIEQSGRHLLVLINDILDLSKIEAGMLELNIESVSLADICQASLQLAKGLAHKKNQKVEFTMPSNAIHIRGDARRLKQMVVNLLSNAIKFTPEYGSLGLDVQPDQVNQLVRLTVWDTGIGIAPENLEQLFQPFVQLESSLARQYEGTGLGLSLVQRMAELHGGSVQVESAPGVGSRFTLLLPWASEDIQPLTFSGPNRPVQKALLVEDNEIDAGQLARYLRILGIESTHHSLGEGVIEAVVQEKPDVILLDLHLPDYSGFDVLKALKSDSATRTIPVIICSVEEKRSQAISLGAAGYLLKPLAINDLRHEMNRIATFLNQSSVAAPVISPTHPMVLIVDDNEMIVETIGDFLQAQNFRVEAVRSGVEMLEVVTDLHPNIILMDIQMPVMDGLEATRRVRAHSDPQVAAVPIIALTALAMTGDRERCLEAGANAYMSKPVGMKQLVEAIRAFVEK